MPAFDRITMNPAVMGGRPCIRGMRVTVSAMVDLLAVGRSFDDILDAYPYLEREDLVQCLEYAAWRVREPDAAVEAA